MKKIGIPKFFSNPHFILQYVHTKHNILQALLKYLHIWRYIPTFPQINRHVCMYVCIMEKR